MQIEEWRRTGVVPAPGESESATPSTGLPQPPPNNRVTDHVIDPNPNLSHRYSCKSREPSNACSKQYLVHNVHNIRKLIIQMPPSYDDFAPPSEIQCSQSKCKANLPAGYKYKTCDKCRNISRLCMERKRKREDIVEGPHRQQPTAPGNNASKEKAQSNTSISEVMWR